LKSNLIKNIYNSLRHINLMFHSIDYNNYLIYNHIITYYQYYRALSQLIPNINLLESDDEIA